LGLTLDFSRLTNRGTSGIDPRSPSDRRRLFSAGTLRTRCAEHHISPPRSAPPPDGRIDRTVGCPWARAAIGASPVRSIGPNKTRDRNRNNRRRVRPPPLRQEGRWPVESTEVHPSSPHVPTAHAHSCARSDHEPVRL